MTSAIDYNVSKLSTFLVFLALLSVSELQAQVNKPVPSDSIQQKRPTPPNYSPKPPNDRDTLSENSEHVRPVEDLCRGVRKRLDDDALFKINEDGTKLTLSDHENLERYVQILPGSRSLERLTSTQIYDGQREFVNQYHDTKDSRTDMKLKNKRKRKDSVVANYDHISLVGYQVDMTDIAGGPHPLSIVTKQSEAGLILRGFTLLKNYDAFSVDAPEGYAVGLISGEPIYDVMSIHVIEEQALRMCNFSDESLQRLCNPDLINASPNAKSDVPNQKWSDKRTSLNGWLRNGPGAQTYSTPIYGPYLNDKRGTSHGLFEKIPYECEWKAPEITGAQVLAYDDDESDAYVVYEQSEFTDQSDDLYVIFTSGDASPKADDLMGVFRIPAAVLLDGQNILLKQQNPQGGVDFIAVVQWRNPNK